MKKVLIILLFLLCVNIVYAEKMEINYTIEVKSYNKEANDTFELYVDGEKWGSETYCDGREFVAPVSIVRNYDCEAREIGTIDTLSESMNTFVHFYNDTRIALFENYANCQKELKNCEVSSEHKTELLKNCNATETNWYDVYHETQASLNACQNKDCVSQTYVDQIKQDAKDRRFWDIGVTAIIVGLIAYVLYFRKGLAKNPYQEV